MSAFRLSVSLLLAPLVLAAPKEAAVKKASRPVPPAFVQAPTASSQAPLPSKPWWDKFADPVLSSLITRALEGNVDLQVAVSRIAEARLQTRVASSRLRPTVEASANAQRIRGGFNQGVIRVDPLSPDGAPGRSGNSLVSAFETGIFSGTGNMRWEADLFGGLRRGVDAAQATVNRQSELADDVRLLLSAEVASAYINLRGAGQRLAITQRQLASQQQTLDLTQVRAKAGLATQFDVERQAAFVFATRANLPALEAQRQQHIHHLAVLLGAPPSTLHAELSALPAGLTPAPEIPVGLPAELLQRRPDVRAAQHAITHAFAQVGVAKADLYPKLSLTGQMGRQGTSIPTLSFGGGNFFGVGPSLTLPIFNAGRLKANLAAERQRLHQAELLYEGEVLAALEETETEIASLAQERQRQTHLSESLQGRRTAATLAEDLYKSGLNDFLIVLDAERELLAAEDALAQSGIALGLRAVALCKALGGGW